MQDTCLHCGSDKIIPGLPLLDHYGDLGMSANNAEVKVEGNPQAWMFTDPAAGRLFVRICGECGHAELRVTNFRELYAKYQQSRGK